MIVKVFGKRPMVWENKRARTVVVKMRGKAIEPFLRSFLAWEPRRTHTIRLNRLSMSQRRPFLRGIVRGLVAGDGSIFVPKKRITFGVTSRILALQFTSIIQKFGIECRSHTTKKEGRKRMYLVVMSGIKAARKFKLRIGLTDPAKLGQLKRITRR